MSLPTIDALLSLGFRGVYVPSSAEGGSFILTLLALFLLALVIVLPILAIVLVVVLWRRVTRLTASLELLRSQTPAAPGEMRQESQGTPERAAGLPIIADVVTSEGEEEAVALPVTRRSSVDWEMVIGRRALGWVSVVLVLFGASFFLKYAYDNQWTGPVGRISTGLIAGVGSMLMGWRYHRRGWRVFAQMFSAGGIVVLLLSVYSSFGFYQNRISILLPPASSQNVPPRTAGIDTRLLRLSRDLQYTRR